jgi:hypothetical protein
MLNEQKLSRALSDLGATADVNKASTEALAASGNGVQVKANAWTIESPDVCPDCNNTMRLTSCLNTSILCCFACRIALPAPDEYVPSKGTPSDNASELARLVDTKLNRFDPQQALDNREDSGLPVFFGIPLSRT